MKIPENRKVEESRGKSQRIEKKMPAIANLRVVKTASKVEPMPRPSAKYLIKRRFWVIMSILLNRRIMMK